MSFKARNVETREIDNDALTALRRPKVASSRFVCRLLDEITFVCVHSTFVFFFDYARCVLLTSRGAIGPLSCSTPLISLLFATIQIVAAIPLRTFADRPSTLSLAQYVRGRQTHCSLCRTVRADLRSTRSMARHCARQGSAERLFAAAHRQTVRNV